MVHFSATRAAAVIVTMARILREMKRMQKCQVCNTVNKLYIIYSSCSSRKKESEIGIFLTYIRYIDLSE